MTVTLLVCTYLERHPSSAENRSQGISTLWPTVKYRSVENELRKRDFELTYFHLCCIYIYTSTNIREIRTCSSFACDFSCVSALKCLFEHVDRKLHFLLLFMSNTHFLFLKETKNKMKSTFRVMIHHYYLYAICFLFFFHFFLYIRRRVLQSPMCPLLHDLSHFSFLFLLLRQI